MWPLNRHSKQNGVTLVELIIAIVIISIAAVALLKGLGQQTRANVDPMIQSQAQLLAKQYLSEVLSKSFFDPSADPRLKPNLSDTAINNSVRDQTGRAGSSNRLNWNNIYEYQGYDNSVSALDGSAIPALSRYRVAITINIEAGLSLGTLSNSAATCPPIIALITVTITDPRNQTTNLSGYRTSYYDPGC